MFATSAMNIMTVLGASVLLFAIGINLLTTIMLAR